MLMLGWPMMSMRIADRNVDPYRSRGIKFILHGGEKHAATGHSSRSSGNRSALPYRRDISAPTNPGSPRTAR